MAADLIDNQQRPAEAERASWQAPRIVRFAAAGARAGSTESGPDGETAKS